MSSNTRQQGRNGVGTILVGIAVCVAVCAPCGRADTAPATEADGGRGCLADAFEGVPLGQHMRLTVAGGATTEGRFAGVRDGQLVLEPAVEQGRVERVSIETIEDAWVRGRATRRGAALGGALVGVATGALAGLAAYALCEVDSCRDEWPNAVAIGLTLGGTAGALAGSLVGTAAPEWQRLGGDTPGRIGDVPGRRALTLNPLGLTAHYGNAQLEVTRSARDSLLFGAYAWRDDVNTGGTLTGFGPSFGYRRYLTGRSDASGLFAQVSGEALWMRHTSRGGPDDGRRESGLVLAAGPLVGYKWTGRSGFTAEVGAGTQVGHGRVGPYEFGSLRSLDGLHGQLVGSVGYRW